MTKDEFVARLLVACPESQPIVDEHLADFENDILLHLLIADVRRFAIAAFEAGDIDVLRRCLDAVGTGMSDGDDYVQNAIGVSFVEDTPLWDATMGPYLATWPVPLKEEAEHQRKWRPGDA
jgi:hypothetical protein